MDKDILMKHFSVLNFISNDMLNELLNKQRGGSNNDFLKQYCWKKIKNTDIYALVYYDNDKKKYYVSKLEKTLPMNQSIDQQSGSAINKDDIDIGVSTAELYGGKSTKNTRKTKTQQNTNTNTTSKTRKSKKNTTTNYKQNLSGDMIPLDE
ncbi:hypothetical protein MseVgp136 [Melanoplus sanguinipes entomopoxvirus]|uniref:Uncharacterized protein n=1 Tax=Melanoplus sanguinipes entomopoxvirus TaxID=83191 RepID=Q9YVV6_MSEPV|nr:hypothetical protein MseVgp136 [Melanoplus sanguinipes entomopoxvirus]AAC97668.1 ORF MSV136 hypothetical protein [Melanoplus sanguinipes entomopoxvirus 'O']